MSSQTCHVVVIDLVVNKCGMIPFVNVTADCTCNTVGKCCYFGNIVHKNNLINAVWNWISLSQVRA